MPFSLYLLLAAGLFATALAWAGAKLRSGRATWMIAGYNTASPEERARYNVEGLAQHLGNGLLTLALLTLATAVSFSLGWTACSLVSLGAFLFVAALVVLGGRRFLPGAAQPGEHRVLRALVSERTFEALRAGTRAWLLECSCGHRADLWSAGGLRSGGAGEPRQLRVCAGCGELRWLKVRRKTEAERRSVA